MRQTLNIFYLICATLFLNGFANAQALQSFESATVPTAYVPTAGTLSSASDRYRMGAKSLRFDWTATSALISVTESVTWTGGDQGFSAWLYLPAAMPGQQFVFEFRNGSTVRRKFAVDAGFTGWRAVHVNFTTHTTLVGSNGNFTNWRLIAPAAVASGTLYLDAVFFSPTNRFDLLAGDLQRPYVNATSDSHWDPLPDYNLSPPGGFPGAVASTGELNGLTAIRNFFAYTATNALSVAEMNSATSSYQSWGIIRNGQDVSGAPLFLNNTGYDDPGITISENLRSFFEDMLSIAKKYRRATAAGQTANANSLRGYFLDMYAHAEDQGFVDGSSMGAIHHHGYASRYWPEAVFHMRDVLSAEGLLEDATHTMAWYFNRNRIFQSAAIIGGNADDMNTEVIGRLLSIILIQDDNLAVAYLREFKGKLDRQLHHADIGFKEDGSIWHHLGFYTGYGIPAMGSVSQVVNALSKTVFRASESAHSLLRTAAMMSRVYANKEQFPPTINGRHPEGLSKMESGYLYQMAMAGTPDGSAPVDAAVAAAYMRMKAPGDSGYNEFAALGISPEQAPSGSWNMPYGCFQAHRRNDWLAVVKGHSKYNWHAETYATENRYARYIGHGSIFVLNQGNPVTNASSGYEEAGWDWNRFPGTTVVHKTNLADLKETVSSVRGFTDFKVVGGHAHKNQQGAFLMQVQGGAGNRFDTSLRATKAYFFFDDRIICIGNGINYSDNPIQEVETTLFQRKLATQSQPMWVNGTQVTGFPYTASPGSGPMTLVDTHGVAYYLPDGSGASLRRDLQNSRDNHDLINTSGNYATAWINHGTLPVSASYQYAMVVGADNAAIQSFATQMATPGSEPYTVLANDPDKIIVSDRATGITTYVLPTISYAAANSNDLFQALDRPGIVMLEPLGTTALDMSVTDPDLNLDPLDTGISYARTLQVTLKGQWTTRSHSSHYRILSSNPMATVVEVDTQHGTSVDVPLAIAENSPPTAPFGGHSVNTLALWHFDAEEVYTNTSGKLAVNEARAGGPGDANANPYGVELTGSVSSFTASGKFGGGHANSDSGAADGATVINSVGLFPAGADPSLTVECWVKFDDLTGTQVLVDKRFGFNDVDGFRLYWNADRFHWRLGDGVERMAISAIQSVQQDTWYHVAATWDADDDTSRIYLNGTQVSAQAFTGKSIVNSAQPVRIGNRNVSTWYPLHGTLDEVRISSASYDYARILPQFDASSVDLGSMEELGSLTYDVTARLSQLAEGYSAAYVKTSGPSWMTVNPTTGVLTALPGLGDQGAASCVIRVVDDAGKAAVITLDLTVTPSTFTYAPWNARYDGTSPDTLGLWHFDQDEVYSHSNGKLTVNESRRGSGEANSTPGAVQLYGDTAFAAGGFDGWGLHFPNGQNGANRAQVINGASYFPTGADPDLTVECWVKFNTVRPGYTQFLIDKQWGYGDSTGYRLILNNDTTQKLVWYLGDGTKSIAVAVPVSLNQGQWYHVAGTWDGSSDVSRLYLNGDLVGVATSTGSSIVNSTRDLVFGQRNVSVFGNLDGVLDEIRISRIAYSYSPGANSVVDAYSLWADGKFTPAEFRLGLANRPHDFDGDTWNNEAEFLLWQDPRNPLNPRMPVLGILEESGEKYLSLTYTRSISGQGTQQSVYRSTDLATWTNADSEMIVVSGPFDNGDGSETVTVRHQTPVSSPAQSRFFVRVRGSSN